MNADNIKEIIFELLQYHRSDNKETEEFIRLKHNAKLCPLFQSKIESISHSFQKYRNITYDMQGINDRGTDILLRISEEDKISFICFQIKSEDDLKDKYYLRNLKAQYFDTKEKYGQIEDYYIILCCNANDKGNKDKIRNVEAEMSKHDDIQVIEPEFSLTFLKMGLTVIDALIKNKISDEDVVFREAISIVDNLTPTEMAILFYVLYLSLFNECEYFLETDIISSTFIKNIFESVPDHDRAWFFYDEVQLNNDLDEEDDDFSNYFLKTNDEIRELDLETRISYDIDYLERSFFDCDHAGRYKLSLRLVYPLAIIMMDGYIRYGYKHNELIKYMMSIRGQIKGYNNFDSLA